MRDFERWLRHNGHPIDDSAPGDHRRIHVGKQKIQLNSRNGHVDLASLKALAKAKELGVRDLIIQVNTG
jgi:hypothetical protein